MSAGWLSTAFALQKGVQGPGWEPDPGANEATAVAAGCSGVAPPSTSPPGCGPSRRAPQGTPAPRHRADRSDVRSKTHDLNQSFTISRKNPGTPGKGAGTRGDHALGKPRPSAGGRGRTPLASQAAENLWPLSPPPPPCEALWFWNKKGLCHCWWQSLLPVKEKKKKRIRIQFRAMTHKG